MNEYNCLAGCVSNYLCGKLNSGGIAGEQADSFAPWVSVTLGEGADKITVGNESYTGDPNTACVKSFEVGWIDSPSASIEIIDEAGGSLGAVMDSLRKCVKFQGPGSTINFQFGWVITTCEGFSKPISSLKFTSIAEQLEVIYSEGKIRYKITTAGVNAIDENMRKDKIQGEDDKPIDIEKAIAALCAEDPPIKVRYAEIQPDGELKDIKFKWARLKDPPKASWQSDNQNRMSVISKWLTPFRIQDGQCDKGIIILWAPTSHDELIILKDPSIGPGEPAKCNNTVGTYIVNGGKCSPVISFNPTVNIINALQTSSAGGGTSGATKTDSNFAEDKKCKPSDGKQGDDVGTQLTSTISQQAHDSYGTDVAYEESLRSEIAHHKASKATSITGKEVTADLTFLGDPSPIYCQIIPGRTVSIVVINPFHIKEGKNSCGEWLAKPGCNNIFSNKNYMISGVNHSISAGSYTTTLKVYLAAPNVTLSPDEPLGGSGSGGPQLKNGC